MGGPPLDPVRTARIVKAYLAGASLPALKERGLGSSVTWLRRVLERNGVVIRPEDAGRF